MNADKKITRISVFDSWAIVFLAIEKSVSNYFGSTFVNSINVFDCHLSDVDTLKCITIWSKTKRMDISEAVAGTWDSDISGNRGQWEKGHG